METFRPIGSAQEKGLTELIDKLPGGKMVELGSAYGESSLLFAKKFEVTAVDVWENFTEGREKEFDERVRDYPNINKLKTNSIEALNHFEDNSLDFCYIDANHSYEYVKGDIRGWLKKIKKGGAIGGHDYSYKFIGTIQAVEELLGHPDYVFRDGSWLKFI
jgi:predicted O-methyltransferase YrrM